MAFGLREIKRRIKSVKNTQQITKAMEMVAAARLKRVQAKLLNSRRYQKEFAEILTSVGECLPADFTNPLILSFDAQDNKNIALLVISSDRGLCGAYNSNVMREVLSFLKKYKITQIKRIFILGRKAISFLRRSEYWDKCEVFLVSSLPDYKELRILFKEVIKLAEEKKVDEVYVIYTQFLSTTKHLVTTEKIIPISLQVSDLSGRKQSMVIFEPKAEVLINNLISSYLEAKLYKFYLEAQTSEQAARMIAMQASGKNAKEMLDRLTLIYNKARQAGITKEILEVVSGAEALR